MKCWCFEYPWTFFAFYCSVHNDSVFNWHCSSVNLIIYNCWMLSLFEWAFGKTFIWNCYLHIKSIYMYCDMLHTSVLGFSTFEAKQWVDSKLLNYAWPWQDNQCLCCDCGCCISYDIETFVSSFFIYLLHSRVYDPYWCSSPVYFYSFNFVRYTLYFWFCKTRLFLSVLLMFCMCTAVHFLADCSSLLSWLFKNKFSGAFHRGRRYK